MKTKARKEEPVSQFQANPIVFKIDTPNELFILSFPTDANLLQRGWQEFHVGNHEKKQICPEDKADRAISNVVTDEIEEDDIGDDDGYQQKKQRSFPRRVRMSPRYGVISFQNLPNQKCLSEGQVNKVHGPGCHQEEGDGEEEEVKTPQVGVGQTGALNAEDESHVEEDEPVRGPAQKRKVGRGVESS